MSLRIWLPLTKDLRNQGLDDVIVTNNGATFDSAGKLGGCYNFDGSDDFISLNGSALYDIIKGGSTPFSIAMWVYRADSTRAILFGDYSLSGGIGFNVELTTAHKLRFYWNGSPDVNTSAACTLKTWSHVAVVYDGTKICFYVNGSLNYTHTVTLSIKTKTTGLYYIGRDYRTGTTAFNGKLNDFRIYDHALSQMEVKELAKGLVLHYPLSSADLINRSTITHGYYLGSNGAEGGDNGWCHTDYIGLIPNSSYIGIGLSAGGANTYAVLYNKDKVLTRTVLLTANQNLSITTSDTEYFIRLSIRKYANELNTTAKFLYVGTIEYDCSGFCNNGTRNGTFDWTSNTAKYSVSQIFNGSNNAIQTPNLTTMVSDRNYTIACWVYKSVLGSKNYQTIYGGPSGFELEARNGTAAEAKFRIHNWGGGSTAYEFNTWYHFCFVHTASDSKLYINGELKLTGSSTAVPSGNYFVGAWKTATQQNYDGLMSDFRIYATALSADDVKSLYQNCATIDPDGTIRGQIRS